MLRKRQGNKKKEKRKLLFSEQTLIQKFILIFLQSRLVGIYTKSNRNTTVRFE